MWHLYRKRLEIARRSNAAPQYSVFFLIWCLDNFLELTLRLFAGLAPFPFHNWTHFFLSSFISNSIPIYARYSYSNPVNLPWRFNESTSLDSTLKRQSFPREIPLSKFSPFTHLLKAIQQITIIHTNIQSRKYLVRKSQRPRPWILAEHWIQRYIKFPFCIKWLSPGHFCLCCGIMHIMHNLRNPRYTACTKCRARQSDRHLKSYRIDHLFWNHGPVSPLRRAHWSIIFSRENDQLSLHDRHDRDDRLRSIMCPEEAWRLAYRASYRTYRADLCMKLCIAMHMCRQTKSISVHAPVHTCTKRICR
jgi:hypothetical protein